MFMRIIGFLIILKILSNSTGIMMNTIQIMLFDTAKRARESAEKMD